MRRILIAEDSASQAVVIQQLLESAGFDAHVVNDGDQAIAELEKQSYDVLVTDLLMPNMDGCELTRNVVKRFSHVPVVVITANGSESLAVDALADGAVSFVPKSLLSSRLAITLTDLIGRIDVERSSSQCGATLLVPEFVVSLNNNLQFLSPVNQYIQRTLALTGALDFVTRLRLTGAISSALVNAVCYGNLDLKKDEDHIGRLINGEPAPECSYAVRLVVSVGTQDLRFSVAHDGPGMVTRASPAPGTPQSFELEDCRGMLLITSVMDHVHYDPPSQEMVMVKNLN